MLLFSGIFYLPSDRLNHLPWKFPRITFILKDDNNMIYVICAIDTDDTVRES